MCDCFREKVRPALPRTVVHEIELGEEKTSMVIHANGNRWSSQQLVCQEHNKITKRPCISNCEPIIEMPPSPEHGYNEQVICDDIEEVPKAYYQAETDRRSKKPVNTGSWEPKHGKHMVLSNPQEDARKSKNIFRLRTEHQAYATIYFLSLQFFSCVPKLDMLCINCRYVLPDEHEVLKQVCLSLLKSKLTIIP